MENYQPLSLRRIPREVESCSSNEEDDFPDDLPDDFPELLGSDDGSDDDGSDFDGSDDDGSDDDASGDGSGDDEAMATDSDSGETKFIPKWVPYDDDLFPSDVLTNVPLKSFRGHTFNRTLHERSKYFSVVNPIKLNPLDWFFEYLSIDFWRKTVDITNFYGQRDAPDGSWVNIMLDEFWRFLVILLYHAVRRPQHLRLLWSTAWQYSNPRVNEIMSRRRFEQILRHLHWNIPEEEGESDIYWKVRPIIDELRSNCKRILIPHCKVSLDEQSPQYTGRTKGLTSCSKGKAAKRYFVIRGINDAVIGGSLYTFVLKGESLDTATHPNLSLCLTDQYVIHLVKQLPQRWHEVYMDNLYMRPNLLLYMYLKHQVLATGTWRRNNGVPDDILIKPTSSLRKMEEESGSVYIAAMSTLASELGSNSDETITLLGSSFYGTKGKPVYFLTSSRYEFELTVGGHKEVERFDFVHAYNTSMGGSDALDAKRAVQPIGIRSKNWFKPLGYWVIDTDITCGYSNNQFLKGKSGSNDRENWIRCLIDGFLVLGLGSIDGVRPDYFRHLPPALIGDATRLNRHLTHLPDVIPQRDYWYCKLNAVRRRVTGECGDCKKALCYPICYKLYHTQESLPNNGVPLFKR